jgi:hypothetical protein
VSTEHTPARREALLDLAQIKCDELLVDMRFLLAVAVTAHQQRVRRRQVQARPITEGPDAEHLATIQEYLCRAAKRA